MSFLVFVHKQILSRAYWCNFRV